MSTVFNIDQDYIKAQAVAKISLLWCTIIFHIHWAKLSQNLSTVFNICWLSTVFNIYQYKWTSIQNNSMDLSTTSAKS
jgi:hypothetical protein